MLRREIIDTLNRLADALHPVDALFDRLVKGGSAEPRGNFQASQVLEVYSNLKSAEKQFAGPEFEMLQLWDLDDLLIPDFWTLFLAPERLEPSIVHRTRDHLGDLLRFLPKVMQLFGREAERIEQDVEQRASGSAVLTLVLKEAGTLHSKPERIIDAISGLQDVYVVLGELRESETGDLTIIGCDSGSDKSFDFLGAAATITAVKDLFLGVWDRVVFFRELKYGERIKQVTSALPLVDQIDALATSGKIGPEKAELLKRQVIEGVTKLLETGASIPEVTTVLAQEPSSLITAKPTLLLQGPEPSPTQSHANTTAEKRSDPSDGLTEGERVILDALMKKSRKQFDS